jgi:hypothetical protein
MTISRYRSAQTGGDKADRDNHRRNLGKRELSPPLNHQNNLVSKDGQRK